ncbi:plasminogen activator inhibitor 1 RNA-binding protein [Nilaparvata lugens]|uniref:plasminogen activator inhibitor 1 RNA-binding protein n=1 Tax=Nilaparvata lugens TaxID=108931 RepID=UPI000B98645F|nr:plasminogen activator inhibitor 1 RNA-binding protein [Nilaparvata lugens]
MENSYSIGVENRYQLFLDSDDDPLEVLKISDQEGTKKKNKLSDKVKQTKEGDANRQVLQKSINNTKNAKLQEAVTKEKKSNFNKSQVTKISIVDGTNVRDNKENKRQDKRSEDQTHPEFNRKDFDNRYERKTNALRNFRNKSFREPKHDETRESDGPKSTNQGDSNGRGGYSNRGRKQFDRSSRSTKTGIKPVDKREGGGAHNWGSYQDELNEVTNMNSKQLNDQVYPTENTDETNPEADGDVKEQESMQESEKPDTQEEPKEMTLDEYKALKGNRQKPMYNLRKANEGEDPSQWKKMYTLTKNENEEDEEEEYERIEYPQRAGRQKLLHGIKYFFKDRFGQAGRAKRGGSRMGSARNNQDQRDSINVNEENEKSSNFSQDAPKIYDEKDFPSLG